VAALIDEWSPRFPVLTQYDACGLLRSVRRVRCDRPRFR
jgi:hypothetical protein